MNLELNSHEVEIVRQLVGQAVRELGPEIHHTHSRSVRGQLNERRQILEQLLARMGEVPVEAAARR